MVLGIGGKEKKMCSECNWPVEDKDKQRKSMEFISVENKLPEKDNKTPTFRRYKRVDVIFLQEDEST